MKKIAKTLWRSKASVLACVVVLTVGLASTALAGTGVGGVFNLGQTNTVNAISTLYGSYNNMMLRVVNTNTGTYARGLSIYTADNKPPLVVENSKSGTATNLSADKVDGKDSSQLIQGYGTVSGNTTSVPASNNQFIHSIGDLAGVGVYYYCPPDFNHAGVVTVLNNSGRTIDLYWDNGGWDPFYRQLASGSALQEAASPGGERYTFRLSYSFFNGAFTQQRVATTEVFAARRASDCNVSVQSVVSK